MQTPPNPQRETRLSKISIESRSVKRIHDNIAQAWKAFRSNPTAADAHRLNNLCRFHDLSDAADELSLIEGAIEEGRDPSTGIAAAENLLVASGVLPPS